MKLTVYEGGKTAVEPSEKPEAREGWSLFRVKACGICGSDIPRVFAGASYFYPIVLGHEFAGVVEESKNPSLVGKRACVPFCLVVNVNSVAADNGRTAFTTIITAPGATAGCRITCS